MAMTMETKGMANSFLGAGDTLHSLINTPRNGIFFMNQLKLALAESRMCGKLSYKWASKRFIAAIRF